MGRERESSRERWREQDDNYDRSEDDTRYDQDWAEQPQSTRPRPRRRVVDPTRQDEYSYQRVPYYEEELVPRRKKRRRRSVWPFLLMGCALGVVFAVVAAAVVVFLALHAAQGNSMPIIPGMPGSLNARTFTQVATISSPITKISQLQICDSAGNVSVKVDPSVTQTTVQTTKTVRGVSQSAVAQEFQHIVVDVQPPTALTKPLACLGPQGSATPVAASNAGVTGSGNDGVSLAALIVNVTFPANNSNNDAVDIAIRIPASATPSDNPSTLVDVEAPLGNINLDGLSGILNIKGGTGNVTVEHAVLVDGSHIETAQGNITFGGFLDIPPDAATPPHFTIQSENGIDVTLPANTNVLLDANTNVGTIKSDFPISISNNSSNGPVSYNGALNPGKNAKTQATLVLDVSTGNVYIHEAQA